MKYGPDPTRRALLLGGCVMALGAIPILNAYRFGVSRHTRELPGLQAPLRIAHLSDLHYGPFIRAGSVRAWVDATLREQPDLIVITGDFVDQDLDGSPEPLLHELARLNAPLGVWGVWGNHDYGHFGASRRDRTRAERHRAAFGAQLAAAGVRVLRNEGAQLRPDLYLGGVDDLWWGEPDAPAALSGARGAALLLSHNPDLLPGVPARAGLTLCGHTHGGQVRLPLVGAVTTASRYGERFARGFVSAPGPAFVSRGLGVSTLPLRLNCQPELVMLDFQAQGRA